MKKMTCVVVLLVVAVMFGAAPLRAQNMAFGVEGGLNLANFFGEDVENNSIKMGMAGGLFMRAMFNEFLGVQPEVQFTMKGATFEEEGVSSQEKTNYIEIPLLLRVVLPNKGKIKPNLIFGPAIGILLSNKAVNGEEIDLKDATNGTDIGVVAGIGVDFMFAKGMLFLDVRDELGFGTIAKEGAAVETAEVKNNVISIMIGYGIRF